MLAANSTIHARSRASGVSPVFDDLDFGGAENEAHH